MEKVDAAYNGSTVLRGVNFEVVEGDFTGVIGPNGGGKTTLLKLMLGLMKPKQGNVVREIERSEIGYLPQVNMFDAQFPIQVKEVVRSGASKGVTFRKNKTTDKRVDELLEKTGVKHLKERAIGELSGGELQRTMLARALMTAPKLLILDEPNTYVDNRFEHELYELLRELNEGMAIVLVSHDVGTITPYIKSIACVNRDLHFHASNQISNEQLQVYGCPIELVTHGKVPHRVIETHEHKHGDS